jgi:hypothetical protein
MLVIQLCLAQSVCIFRLFFRYLLSFSPVVAAVTFDAKGAKALMDAGIGRHVPVSKRDEMYDLIIRHSKVCNYRDQHHYIHIALFLQVCKVAEISSEKFNDLTEIEKIKVSFCVSISYTRTLL